VSNAGIATERQAGRCKEKTRIDERVFTFVLAKIQLTLYPAEKKI
jgi:hypothetical protein